MIELKVEISSGVHGFFIEVKQVFEKFFKITKRHGLNLAYSNTNSLGKFIKNGKNKLNSAQCCNVEL